MGTSNSVGQLVGKINRLATEVRDQKGALNATGLAGKKIFQQAAAQAGVLGSTVAGKRKAIDARYDLSNRRTKGAGEGMVIITYTGPAHLLNNPTAQHFIGARRLGTRAGHRRRAARVGATAAFGGSNRGAFGALRNGRGKRALTIGGNLRPYAFHPGTRGKHFFEKARAVAVRTLPGVYARAQLTAPLKEIFK